MKGYMWLVYITYILLKFQQKKFISMKYSFLLAAVAFLLVSCSGNFSSQSRNKQEPVLDENYVPAGYTLKFQDEFNDARISGGKPALPNTDKWWYENLQKGAVNNELQTYVSGFSGTDTVAAISDGTLKIIARKKGTDIISARINTKES